MANILNPNIRTDGTPMTPGELSIVNAEPSGSSRLSSGIYGDQVDGSDSDQIGSTQVNTPLYTERPRKNMDPFEYDYDKNDPGYVMIINQMNFSNTKENQKRCGSYLDVDEIIRCFGRQGYNINQRNIINDATKEELFNEIKRVCNDELGDTNSLIVFVMSHGEPDNKFQVYDGTVTIQELIDPFLAVKEFSNKPKIFIFQTCKTNAEHRRQQKYKEEEQLQLYVNTALTAEPNLLMYCSTLEGNYAYRDKKKGSWFIQELCRNIYTYGHREEFLSILMRCNKCLAKNYYHEGPQEMNEKQTPLFISTLTKNFYVCRSKDRYFYVDKLNELRKAQKDTDELLKTMTMRRRTFYQ